MSQLFCPKHILTCDGLSPSSSATNAQQALLAAPSHPSCARPRLSHPQGRFLFVSGAY